MIFRFRGIWPWAGAFDYYWISPIPWIAGLAIGSIIGFLIASLPRFNSWKVTGKLFVWTEVSAFILAFINWLLGKLWADKIGSPFPPTRFFAVGVFLVTIGGLWFAFREENSIAPLL